MNYNNVSRIESLIWLHIKKMIALFPKGNTSSLQHVQ